MPTKKTTSKSVKTTTRKQTASKKVKSAKRSKKPKVHKSALMTLIDDPEPTPPEPDPMPPPMPGPEQSRVVFSKSCRRCAHLPLGLNAVLGMLVGIVVLLSVVVLAATVIIDSQDFRLDSYKHGGISFASFDD